MWFIGVDVEQETGAPPPKKNPGSAPDPIRISLTFFLSFPTITCNTRTKLLNLDSSISDIDGT